VIGERNKEKKLFYYLRPEELIPQDHILRLVHDHIDFSFIRSKVKHLYSYTGRPSVDPEVMMRMLLVGYLFGIISERRLCDEVQMHLGYRWFVGLTLEDKVPDHSTFSKNRHGRFKESGIYQEMFDEIVRLCAEKGLVSGKHLTVDSTLVKANASFRTMEPVVVQLDPREYLKEVEKGNPQAEEKTDDEPWEPKGDLPYRGAKLSNQTHRSRVDPDARITRKTKFSETYLGHAVSYLMDNKSRIILGADRNRPSRRADCETAVELTRRVRWVYKLEPKTLGADKGYASGDFVHELLRDNVRPHIPIVDTRRQHEEGIYPLERFQYDPEQDRFICPEGKTLRYWGIHRSNSQRVYRASVRDCGRCPVKKACTRASYRSLSHHIYESSLQTARELTKTPSYRLSQIMRKRVEELFGEAKEFMGLRHMKFRGAIFVREQVLLTAMTQNIKRMVKLLSSKSPKDEASKRGVMPSPTSEATYRLAHWICHLMQAKSSFEFQLT
jgi:transposase